MTDDKLNKATVEKSPFVFAYKLNGEQFELRDASGWVYGGTEGRKSASLRTFETPGIKLRVDTIDSEDLVRLQKVLIPALEKEPELMQLVPAWKTSADAFSADLNDGKTYVEDAKGFILYVKDPDRVKHVMAKVDSLLEQNGLGLSQRMDSGSVDVVRGKSNRIGYCRDKWEAANVAPGTTPPNDGSQTYGARLGSLLENRIKAKYGVDKLSSEQLRTIETDCGIKRNTLVYDHKGKLMLRATNKDSGHTGRNSFYLTEGGAETSADKLQDRPAMYALSNHFHVDQLDSYIAERPPLIKMSLQAGEARTVNELSLTSGPLSAAEQQAIGLPASSEITVGRDDNGVYIIDTNHTTYVWEADNYNGLMPQPKPSGTKVRIEPNQKVRLGKINGPELDPYSDTNEVVLAGQAGRAAPPATDLTARASAPAFHTISIDGQQRSINKTELILGRSKGDVLLPDCTSTSGRHAAIRLADNGSAYLRDLGSTNGTTHNGRRLKIGPGACASDEVLLRAGDKIGIPSPDTEYIFTGLKYAPLQRLRPNDLLEYKIRPKESNSITAPASVEQSKLLQENHELKQPLPIGFQDIPNGTVLSASGTIERGDPTTVFDPTRDQLLQRLFQSAHSQLDELNTAAKELELRTALAKLAHDSLTPRAGWTSADLDRVYETFCAQHSRRQILLSEFIRQAERSIGGGACSQHALLYKALCDEFGLEAKIVRGHITNELKIVAPTSADFRPNHAWVVSNIAGQDMVFDPRSQIYGVLASDLPHYCAGKAIINQQQLLNPAANSTGSLHEATPFSSGAIDPLEVVYEGSNWRVEGRNEITGKLILSQHLRKPVSIEEFTRLNGDIVPQRVAIPNHNSAGKYKVQRSDGRIESDWDFAGWIKSERAGGPVRFQFTKTMRITGSQEATVNVPERPK